MTITEYLSKHKITKIPMHIKIPRTMFLEWENVAVLKYYCCTYGEKINKRKIDFDLNLEVFFSVSVCN